MRKEEIAVGALGALLVATGLYLALRRPPRVKKAGDRVRAIIRFKGRGPKPDDFEIGFSLDKAVSFHKTFRLDLTPEWNNFEVEVEGTLPTLAPKKYNATVFIRDPITKRVYLDTTIKEVYTVE